MGDSPNYPLLPPSVNQQQQAAAYSYNLSMLYYGFFVVATAGVILSIYHCLVIRSFAVPSWPRDGGRSDGGKDVELQSSTFKYRKGKVEQGVCSGNEECVVCLCVFEEGEDVRELIKCKHSFHASCIDMWLYSHFDCPLCRAPIRGDPNRAV